MWKMLSSIGSLRGGSGAGAVKAPPLLRLHDLGRLSAEKARLLKQTPKSWNRGVVPK